MRDHVLTILLVIIILLETVCETIVPISRLYKSRHMFDIYSIIAFINGKTRALSYTSFVELRFFYRVYDKICQAYSGTLQRISSGSRGKNDSSKRIKKRNKKERAQKQNIIKRREKR